MCVYLAFYTRICLTIAMWLFQDRVSFNIIPRKLKVWTRSIIVLSILTLTSFTCFCFLWNRYQRVLLLLLLLLLLLIIIIIMVFYCIPATFMITIIVYIQVQLGPRYEGQLNPMAEPIPHEVRPLVRTHVYHPYQARTDRQRPIVEFNRRGRVFAPFCGCSLKSRECYNHGPRMASS